MLLIPAIDLRSGRCVRLRQGAFDAQTLYCDAAEELLERFVSWGATWLHVVDLDGARTGNRDNRAVIAALAARGSAQLQVGGGIRTTRDLEELLDAGVARVVIGSVAAERPALTTEWVRRFGPERICLAFDVQIGTDGVPRVRTRGWLQETQLDLYAAVASHVPDGVRHVLCTDIGRDGMLSGPNLDLYGRLARDFPHLAWQASGGVRYAADLACLAAAGVACAISGKALIETHIPPEELQPYLQDASSPASTYATDRS